MNGSAELITDKDGEVIFLVSKGRNQFLALRELLLGYLSLSL